MAKWNDLKFRRKNLRLKNFNYNNPNFVYFITICGRHLTNPFPQKELAEEVIKSPLFIREDKGINVYCYCLMPDHLHIAISPSTKSGSVSKILHDFKSYTTNISRKSGLNRKLWQKSFYDHIGRREEDLVRVCEYILVNPVRKGLVERYEDWGYSGLLDPLPV
jgi:REP element-mobilizing transposase RayT